MIRRSLQLVAGARRRARLLTGVAWQRVVHAQQTVQDCVGEAGHDSWIAARLPPCQPGGFRDPTCADCRQTAGGVCLCAACDVSRQAALAARGHQVLPAHGLQQRLQQRVGVADRHGKVGCLGL